MRKRSFFGLSKPCFHYELATDYRCADPVAIPTPETVTLYIKQEMKRTSGSLKVGTPVKDRTAAGTRTKAMTICAISSVTGTICAIAPFLADYGRAWTAVTIKTEGSDSQGHRIFEASQAPSWRH
jgi:electron transport complex protein RnfC